VVKMRVSEMKKGVWTFKHVAKNIWKIYITASPHSITMSGSDVTTQLHIDFPHRFLRIHLYHTSSAYAASTDALALTVERPVATVPTLARFTDQLFREYDITASKLIEVFGEAFEYEECIWSIVLNSTSTDLVFLEIYVQLLEH